MAYLSEDTEAWRELAVLKAIEGDPGVSQREMGRRMSLSGAAVNVIVKKLARRGLLEIKGANLRRMRYLMTPAGRKRFEELSRSFIRSATRLLTEVRREVAGKLMALNAENVRRVAIWGSGDVMDLVWLAMADLEMEVVALIDDNPTRQGLKRHKMIIQPSEALAALSPDAVVITARGPAGESLAARARALSPAARVVEVL